ncbi:hypothetical protein [Mycetocola spongiae]|uniref:hypothetical protein n=1 Tax=Mycetocola spongiae TaxID=2859226 RepID=UPI001CF57B59|nr:hypothetical protein [Mycetocola spongiae]UCR88423.1 hypothetical protein KXZ72_10670 [Mycetocola spongiae]
MKFEVNTDGLAGVLGGLSSVLDVLGGGGLGDGYPSRSEGVVSALAEFLAWRRRETATSTETITALWMEGGAAVTYYLQRDRDVANQAEASG